MYKPLMRMEWTTLLVVFWVCWSSFFRGTHQLQSSQTQVLLQLRKHLEYPKQLDFWYNSTADFCYLSSPQVNITCQDNFVAGITIMGDKPSKMGKFFEGFSVQDQTLSENFSMDSFVTTLARLTSLRNLTLVSLGIWGALPLKIHRLYSLQNLDLSWNFLFGSVPPTVSRLVKLETLTLDGNFFNGSFPVWFDSLLNLTVLSLKNNEISGKLPDLSGLERLNVLDLSGNKLDSQLPNLPKGLIFAFLSNNSFSGEIPVEYRQLYRLQQLDLSFNSLKGTIPASLFSLPNITYLNLASNTLGGSFPTRLSCGDDLEFVDISNNRLLGRLPSCLRSKSGKMVVKSSGNCLSNDLRQQNPESYCVGLQIKGKEKSKSKNLGKIVGFIIGISVVLGILGFGFLVLCKKYCYRGTPEQHLLHKSVHENSISGFPSELLTSARFISEAKLGRQGVPIHRLFSFEELKEATNNFDKSSLLGEGSTGKLYRGRLGNGTQVAIRHLPVSKKYTIRNLKLRLELLAKLRHPHLVCFMGHCIDDEKVENNNSVRPNKVYLVYEYVPNGNYRSHLLENSPEKALKWSERLAILIGIAKAVHFLHTGIIPGFFNNRLKANNILLNEHRMAKLSDYGLSIVSQDHENHDAKGEGRKSWQMQSLEDDVCSYGFILLESIVGPAIFARREAFILNEMASLGSQEGRRRIVDPNVLASSTQESLSIVISITQKCISLGSPAATRPSFEDVLWNLQYAAQVQADGDHRFSDS